MMRKKIVIYIFLAFILRLILASCSYHSDIVPFDFAGRVIARGNIANFYDYLWDLPDGHQDLAVYPRNLFNFPPLTYFFLGGVSRLVVWMVNPDVYRDFLYNFSATLGNWNLNLLLLFLKLPYFFFDFGIALLLYKFFNKPKNKNAALILWLFNPVSLYAVYMIASYDIIPAFFVVLVLYLVKQKPSRSLVKEALLLGLGGAFKIYPLMFLVPLALIKDKWSERLKIVGAGMAVYAATILPFLGSPGFRRTALLAGQTAKSLYAQIPISGGEAIMLFPALLVFLYLVFLFKKGDGNAFWIRFFLVLLLFFSLTHYHPQWFLWLMPLLIIDLVVSKLRHWPLVVLAVASYFGLVLFFDPGLSVWLFTPLFPSLLGMKDIWSLLGMKPDPYLARSILHSLFAGGLLYYFVFHIRAIIRKT